MSLEKFFNPRSVAIIGASGHSGKVGYEILANIIRGGYEGQIFPVNSRAEEVQGHKCYPDLASIAQPVDLAVIVIPASAVPEIMEQCGAAGIKAVVVITAGFKEVGPEGKRLEQQILEIASRFQIRVIGPNCLGLIDTSGKLNASFGGDMPKVGSIGYISQSGALLAAILDMANATGMGFSKLVSIGNKADVDELDVIQDLGRDPETKVIAGYLESIGDGNSFLRRAEQISYNKPILLMKSGGTGAGAEAASSHTGSLAGSETAYECVFERGGIVRCDSIKTQFDFARAFANQPLPDGDRVVVLTNAGGPGIMAADAIEQQGLTFARLQDQTIQDLSSQLPPASNVHNPVDILGDALDDRYEFAMRTVICDGNVDAVLVLLTPQAMTQSEMTARAIVKVHRDKPDKPVFACFLGAEKVANGVEILREGGIPQYDCPESAVRAIRAMSGYSLWRKRPKRIVRLFPVNRRKVEKVIDRHLRSGSREIGEMESKEILEAYGFVTPKGSIATTAEQAVGISDQLGYPVVLKIWSPDIIHKSDVGGVRVGLGNAREVMDAFDLMMYRIPKKLPDANILGVLVQQMCKGGMEVIFGMNRDPQFGPMIMFGMGGIMVEVLKDVSFYLAPVTSEEAKEMLRKTRTYKMLQGVRGQKGVDLDAIAEGLQRLSQLVTEFPQIREMDINPYLVGREGVTPIAVDARITVAND